MALRAASFESFALRSASRLPSSARESCRPVPPSLIVTLEFESMGTPQQGMGSAEGRAVAGSVPNFATGGVQMLTFDAKDL